MIRLGLIGYPLGHSLSPRIHRAALPSCGLEGDYSLFPIPPEDKQSLGELLGRVRSGEIQGLNVTIPHKQNVIPFLDELTPTANSIGAVNTIYLHDHKLVGDNTDAPGFLIDLKRLLTTGTRTPWHCPPGQVCPGGRRQGKHGALEALVLGAGGAARAIVYALVSDGWNVMIAARRAEQANEVAKQFQNVKIMELNVQTFQRLNIQLIVNATPVGMAPNIHQSPWPENLPFPMNAPIYDLVYNPSETKLVKDARAQGLRAATGLGMLIEQAALAFQIWTGHDPSREILRTSLEQSLITNY